MAPSLPSCIGNAFCSHRQASCFLLATLIPFFFPILILCVPFLLLFLAPLSFFLLSLLLLYKVQALIKPKRSRIPDKGAFLRQPGFAEEKFLEEDKERRRYEDVPESEELNDENVQRLAAFQGGDAEVLHATSSFGSESTGEEHVDVKEVGSESEEELDDVKEAQARHKEWDEKQEEGNVIEGIVENREEGLSVPHRDKVEDEVSQFLALPSTESSIALTKEEQDEIMEGMSPKHEGTAMGVQEEDLNLEGSGGNFQDEHSMSISSVGLGEGTLIPSTHEQGSLYSQPDETFLEEQDVDPRKVVPTVQSGVHAATNDFDEGPSKDGGDEIFEIAPLRVHEQGSSHFQLEGTPEVASEFIGDEHDDVKEASASPDLDKKQEEGNVTEGMVENREEGLSIPHRDRVEDEGMHVVALPSTESSIALTKKEQDDMMEGMSPKQGGKAMEAQEEDVNLEGTGGDFQDEHSMSSPSHGPGEGISTHLPFTHEQGSLYSQPEETLSEEQGADFGKDLPTIESGAHGLIHTHEQEGSYSQPEEALSEEQGIVHTHEQGSSYSQPEEALSEEQGIVPGKYLPTVESDVHGSMDEFDEGPSKDGGDEIFEIDPHRIHEQGSSHFQQGETPREEQDMDLEKDLTTGELVAQGWTTEFDELPSKDGGDEEVDPRRIHEHASLHFQSEETPPEQQGIGRGKDGGDEVDPHRIHEHESLHFHPEETPPEEQRIGLGKDLPTGESGDEDGGEEVDLHGIHEHGSPHFQPEETRIGLGKDIPTVESGDEDGGEEVDPHRIHEHGSPDFQPEETPPEEQGIGLEKDIPIGESGVKDGGDEADPHCIHEHGSPHFQPEETPPEERGIDLGKDLPTGESGVEGSMKEFEEGPSKDGGDEIFEIGTRHTHLGMQEHKGEEPVLFFEKPSGSGSSDLKLGKPEEQESLLSMEKEMEEGEPSSTVTDSIEPWRADAFAKELQEDTQAKELQEDTQPQQGRPVNDMEVSTKSEFPEGDRPSGTSSSLERSTQGPLEGVGSQDKMQENHRILSDIYAIKKIIGYQGEDHVSLMEQITALYLFLGMEPYEWDVGVDDLEKARAEVELLKVVVGVK